MQLLFSDSKTIATLNWPLVWHVYIKKQSNRASTSFHWMFTLRITKHHGRCSQSDHLCQDGVDGVNISNVEWISVFVKYPVEISDFALILFRRLLRHKVCRILRKNGLIPLISVSCSLSTRILLASDGQKSAQNRFVQCFNHEKHGR